MVNILFSLSIAVGIPALVLGLVALSPIFLLYAAAIGWMHAVFLALPTFLVLNKFKLANIYTPSLSGFVIAAVPFGIWQFSRENLEMKSTNQSRRTQ
jgi:hypothetical protein